ncbi:MAG: 1-acyl-sn-glycerol-3-phosphate acyltransferase [Firmicutes bacterium]|nr:1-acyl-sn-glycerol-3-phosphate acyltransferase [Bacillota bacterium]
MENRKLLEQIIQATDGTYSFNGESALQMFKALFGTIKEMGLDPMKKSDFKTGLYKLFNIELVNMPDLENGRFILAPNHVSDIDALVLGLLHPKILIVIKQEWDENEKLKVFKDMHYHTYGLDRTNVASLRNLMRDSIEYFTSDTESKHFLVFCQGTISDFNKNSLERISKMPQTIQMNADVPIVPIFIEQVSLTQPTRVVFGKPIKLTRDDNYAQAWLDTLKKLQDGLKPVARKAKLTHKHSNNNKPSDPFFAPDTKPKN